MRLTLDHTQRLNLHALLGGDGTGALTQRSTVAVGATPLAP